MPVLVYWRHHGDSNPNPALPIYAMSFYGKKGWGVYYWAQKGDRAPFGPVRFSRMHRSVQRELRRLKRELDRAPGVSGCTALASVGFASSNVRSIGEGAFRGCVALTTVSFADSNMSSIGPQAFSGCTALASVGFASSNVRSIGEGAFCGCVALTTVSVASSNLADVGSIGSDAFKGCTALASLSFADGDLAPPYCTCRIGLAAKLAFSRYPWWCGYSALFLVSTTASEPQPQARGRSTTFHRLWTPSRLSGLATGVLRGRRSLQSGSAGFFR